MHVPVRNAQQAGGDAVPAELDDVGIRPGGTGSTPYLHRHFVILGGLLQRLENARADVRATEDDRAGAEPSIAELLLVIAGRVGGVGDVHGHADRRVDAVRARGGAAEAVSGAGRYSRSRRTF